MIVEIVKFVQHYCKLVFVFIYYWMCNLKKLNLTLHAGTRQVNNLFQDLQNRFPYLGGWGWVQSDFGVTAKQTDKPDITPMLTM